MATDFTGPLSTVTTVVTSPLTMSLSFCESARYLRDGGFQIGLQGHAGDS
ncbi:MAG TPA: hypothetical protein HPP50_06630, partial [Rhodospirillaceae bacterium]|nr:hypothetical protein [Rhodospirillaceae bacterium]